MAFVKTTFIFDSELSDTAPRKHSYLSAADAMATISASGYFNSITQNLAIHDVIFVSGSDDNLMLEVTSATGAATVTTANYTDPAGGITLADGDFLVGNASNVAAAVTMSGDVTIANTGVATVGAGAIDLAMLSSGITPSHIVVYAGEFTTVGGDANETITQAGVLATDLVHVTLHTVGATPRTITTAAAASGQVDVVMSGDPSTDHVLTWSVMRAAA